MSNNQQIFEEMEISEFDMSKCKSKNKRLLIIKGISILLIIAIIMSTIFINSKFIEAKLDDKIIQLEKEVAYNRIENYLIRKLKTKMSYKEGQETCHKMYGNILEFDERTDYKTKLQSIIGK